MTSGKAARVMGTWKGTQFETFGWALRRVSRWWAVSYQRSLVPALPPKSLRNCGLEYGAQKRGCRLGLLGGFKYCDGGIDGVLPRYNYFYAYIYML